MKLEAQQNSFGAKWSPGSSDIGLLKSVSSSLMVHASSWKITTFLTYDDQAEEAAKFYVSVFKNSRIGNVTRYGEAGEPGPCGFLKDRFGLYGQINPTILSEMLSDPDPKKSKRVMEAMLKMKKISIEGLKRAYKGG